MTSGATSCTCLPSLPLFVKCGLPLGYGRIFHLGKVSAEGPVEGTDLVVLLVALLTCGATCNTNG